MRLVFVAQESTKISKGTVQIWRSLYQCWPKDAHITVLLNRTHWAALDVEADVASCPNLRCVRLPWRVPSEWFEGGEPAAPQTAMLNLLRRAALAGLRKLQAALLAPLTVLYLVVWLRRTKADGILSHNGGWPGGELNRWVIWAGFIARVPLRVLVIHNMPVKRAWMARPWAWFHDRTIGWLTTQLVTVSRACRMSLEQGTVLGRGFKMIHNGISLSAPFAPTASADPPWNVGCPAVGFVGEVAPRKGLDVLVDAMEFVREPCQLIVIGAGGPDYERRLRARAERSPWDVHFLGFRDDVLALYPLLDLVVLPSLRFESFGMTILEAMMHDRPVVCSDFGGMKEIVVHGVTGLVVAAGDVSATAAALNALLPDVALRRRMGGAGRQRLEEHFSAVTMTKQYVALFASVAS
jgi:teichuronic acid biosynthesis glycosyltransferase TuaC